MGNKRTRSRRWQYVCSIVLFFLLGGTLHAQTGSEPKGPAGYQIVVLKGSVEVARAGAQTFDAARIDQMLFPGDRVRVAARSQLTLRRGDQSIYRFYESSEFQILAPRTAASTGGSFRLLSGLLYFFRREPPSDVDVETLWASAASRGTEFQVQVDANGTVVTVIDGEVMVSNLLGAQAVKSREEGFAAPGQAPVVRPALNLLNTIQWTFYYPGILDVDELQFTAEESSSLGAAIEAYRSGDLLRALSQYPAGRTPQSAAERVFRAALLLSVGQVDAAQSLLGTVAPTGVETETSARLASALENVIAAVKLRPPPTDRPPELATEWLAQSYREQTLAQLPQALRSARAAVAKSPRFGFGWERVAELEFSFGRINEMENDLARAIEFSPGNAQAAALQGFVFAARNKFDSAIRQFDKAIALDGGLANGWLGRGLCLIRTGKTEAGREDLLTAAAMEPQRAVLRSYLGKAWADAGDGKRAEHELSLAQRLDPQDPTAWLYSALLKQQENQINDAIRDLEHAQDLSTNRAVYRSLFLLDQDRAVRSANLAHIYRDAGMSDWSLWEAGRAVASDYGNYSAHLFLANSYDEFRDPSRINLRYETAAETEYFIANLLAPVSAGTLSQSISQGEFSKLFERNRPSLVSRMEYLSRGAWYENGAIFGTFGNAGYSFEGIYRSDRGQRPNNDFEERELRLHLKQQITPNDSIYLRAVDYSSAGGDRFQYYNQDNFNSGLRTEEQQQPDLILGYHHEWNRGSHLIVAGSRFNDGYQVADPQAVILRPFAVLGQVNFVSEIVADYKVRTQLELYSTEAQQIWETPRNTAIVGARFQSGEYSIENLRFDPGLDSYAFPQPPTLPDAELGFQRWGAYAYDSFRILEPLLLIGGLSYEQIRYPANFRSPPVSDAEESKRHFLPKAGIVWSPTDWTTVRAGYTRSLGGAGLDQSVRIEPTQIGGFNQAFRSILPESIGGANAGERFTTYDASVEQRLWGAAYIRAGIEQLNSEIDRRDGAYLQDPIVLGDFVSATTLRHKLSYRERSLNFALNQLLGEEWALGAQYKLTEATLNQAYPDIPVDGFADQHVWSVLHQLDVRAIFNHKSGFFAQFDALWNLQSNFGYTEPRPGDDFWQLDLLAGYRLPRRRAQIVVGALNLTGQDYQLNPLVFYNERPRDRTFVTRVDLSF